MTDFKDSGLKIAVIGGGSTYTPELAAGFLDRSGELPLKEIWLVDIPEGAEKLQIVGGLVRRMFERAGIKPRIELTLDREAALAGADFVITQFRVGGLAARIRDERLPLRYGVIGSETVGPGGFAKALRTIPVILDIARDMTRLCPEAWLINFTNPAGMVTEAVLNHTAVRCIGLCNVPINMVKMVAKMLDVPEDKIRIEFAGLNHLVWGRRIFCGDREVTGKVLERLADGAALTMRNIPDLKWERDTLVRLGAVPCPYHRYYYMTGRILAEQMADAAPGGKGTRAEQVRETESRLLTLYQNEKLAERPAELAARGGAHYSEAAVSLLSAIYNDKQEVHTVDVLNRGTLPELPPDAVVEVNCVVGRSGAAPLPLPAGALPPDAAALAAKVKRYEQLAIKAAVAGDREAGRKALAEHPLVPSSEVAEALFKDILAVNRPYLPQFFPRLV